MKTIFNTKTGSNNQVAISKSLAGILSITLVSATLNAQVDNYSFQEKSRVPETTLAMVNNTTGTSRVADNAKTYSAFTETATEEALDVESWMMNESNFATMPRILTERESALEIESWMTNESVFNTNSSGLETEQEEALGLESWMTDENTFNYSTHPLTAETESALEIESWMLTDKVFSTKKCVEQPLQIEAWMLSELAWK